MNENTNKVPKNAQPAHLTGGSRKGSPNKNTAAVKEMVLMALDNAGGAEYLLRCAEDPKLAGAFLTLVGKVLPLQVTGGLDVQFSHITRTIIDP